MDPLEDLIADHPRFHEPETEVARTFDPAESFLEAGESDRLRSEELAHYGIGDDVLRFLAAEVAPGDRTLEIGAGSTTLVFGIRQARHTAVCPAPGEVDRIRAYADEHDIELGAVDFVLATSEAYLPAARLEQLDLVLLDGKHAFPWPMLDWFFTVDALRPGGLLLVDDVHIRAVAVLDDFLRADPAWEHTADFGKTQVFRKLHADVLDVAWHMQPWMQQDPQSRGTSVGQDATALARRVVGGTLRRVRGR